MVQLDEFQLYNAINYKANFVYCPMEQEWWLMMKAIRKKITYIRELFLT